MKRFAVVFAVVWAFVWAGAGLYAAEARDRTFTGVIYDNRCSDGVCATQCPVSKTPKYTLQTGSDGWLLTDQKTPVKYLGKKVTVTGHPTGGNRLKVVSIALSAAQAT